MLKRLQQWVYRLIVPDSWLTGWRSFDRQAYITCNKLNYVVLCMAHTGRVVYYQKGRRYDIW